MGIHQARSASECFPAPPSLKRERRGIALISLKRERRTFAGASGSFNTRQPIEMSTSDE
jgi:hypothetical protein